MYESLTGDAVSVGAVAVARLPGAAIRGLDFPPPRGVFGSVIKAGSLKLCQYQIEK